MPLSLYADTEDEAIQQQLAAQYGALPTPPPFVPEAPAIESYNPDRPSTWDAPDSPKLTTLDRARNMEKAYLARDVPAAVAEFDDEDDAAVQRGLSPYAVAGAAGLQGERSRGSAKKYEDMLLDTVNVPSSPNPLRPIREEYATQMLGDGSMITDLDAQGNVIERPSGLVSQEAFQTELHQGALIDEQRAHAAAYAQEAGRQQAQIDAQEYKIQQQQARREHAIQASQLVQAKVTEAADRLNEAADIDPNRYWASQSAGRKFAWALQAGLMGFAGLDPFGALQSAIRDDIDAQKANFAQKQAGFGARMDELAGARSVYGDIRESIQDETATDLMMEAARLQQADAAFKAMASKEGIPPMVAASNVFLTQMQQRNAEITMGLQELLARTPERIGGGVRPALRGPIRQTVETLRKEAAGEGRDLRKVAVEKGFDAATQDRRIEGDIAVEGVKATGRANAAQAKAQQKSAETLAARIQDPQDVIAIIDNMLNLSEQSGGGVPGQFGPLRMPEWAAGDQQLEFAANKGGLRLIVQKWASGAHLSPEQFEQVEKMIPSDSELTGGRAVVKLRALKRFMQNISKSRQRGFDETTRKVYHRAEDLPSLEPQYVPGDDEPDPVDIDE